MATLFVQNDMNLVLSAMSFALDGSPINDAMLTAHFFDSSGAAGSAGPVTNASNAGPIVITSPGHGLSANQQIVICDVTGNEAANGCWAVTVIDTNTFSLQGSAASGTYNRAGNWYKAIANGFNLTMTYQAGSNGTYVAVIPYTIDRVAGENSTCIIFCANYNYQLQRAHSSILRT